MPTYEYVCDSCNHEFERFQSITESPLRKCPDCGRLEVRRLISGGAGFLFKGSGFYITDYRSDGYKQAAKKEKEAVGNPASAPSDSKKKKKKKDAA